MQNRAKVHKLCRRKKGQKSKKLKKKKIKSHKMRKTKRKLFYL